MKVGNITKTILNSKFVKNQIKKSSADSKYLARALLLTSVSKDVFAYGIRVHNTLNNDKIPKDIREYSAEVDAATAVATAVTQIGTGILVSSDKFQKFCTDRLFSSLKNSPKELKHAKSAFNALSTLVLASVFAKRILTPIIAVEFAGYEEKQKANKKHTKDGV